MTIEERTLNIIDDSGIMDVPLRVKLKALILAQLAETQTEAVKSAFGAPIWVALDRAKIIGENIGFKRARYQATQIINQKIDESWDIPNALIDLIEIMQPDETLDHRRLPL